MALEETDFDAEAAVALLREFQQRHGEELGRLHARRVRFLEGRERSRGAAGGGGRDPGASSSGGDASRSPGREGRGSRRDRDRRRRDQRDRRDKKRSRRSRSRSRSRSPKRSRKGAERAFLTRDDRESRRPEFTLWARDERGTNVDNLPRREEDKVWAEFVDRYNTGALEHRKYYDLARYERKKAEKWARLRGIRVVTEEERAAERGAERERRGAREREVEEERRREREEGVRRAYDDLKRSGRADRELEEARARAAARGEAQAAFKLGDSGRMERAMRKLQPGRGRDGQ